MLKQIGNIISGIGDLIFPNVCMACLEEAAPASGSNFCVKCMFEIPYTDHFNSAENDLYKFFLGKLTLENAGAVLYFNEGGITQNILHNFKYNKMQNIGKQLGSLAGEKMLKSGFYKNVHAIIPVPLHKVKLYERGYNQSEIFGRSIAYEMNLPILTDVLLRSKYTATQTKKSKGERKENVENAFIVKHADKIRGKSIVLVDDVVTTGATIVACAQALIDAGVKVVSIICIAKAT